jgi:hypothetical protein
MKSTELHVKVWWLVGSLTMVSVWFATAAAEVPPGRIVLEPEAGAMQVRARVLAPAMRALVAAARDELKRIRDEAETAEQGFLAKWGITRSSEDNSAVNEALAAIGLKLDAFAAQVEVPIEMNVRSSRGYRPPRGASRDLDTFFGCA